MIVISRIIFVTIMNGQYLLITGAHGLADDEPGLLWSGPLHGRRPWA